MKLSLQDYVDYIKLQLTADLIELEIPDATISKYVTSALVELNRYIDQPRFITIPYSPCIDLGDFTDNNGQKHKFNYSAIVHVRRTEGFTGDASATITGGDSAVDPMYAQTWMAFSGGTVYNLQNYVMNYAAYNTLLQMRNTTSTDLNYIEDKDAEKLYINCNYDRPRFVTIEYIPVYTNVEEITSDYWIDILKKLSLAMTKIGLGRVRTRFKQTNALWDQDGETLLQEGNEEIKELRELLRVNSQLMYPGD